MQTKSLLPLCLIAISLGGVSQVAEARIKCWTNKDGIRECGESVPPEYSQKSHQELNDQGLVIEKQERAKTPEELATEAKQAAAEAEKQRLLEEKKKEDNILLQTFSKVEDIKQVRDEQINALEGNIKVTIKRNEKIQEDLDTRIARAAAQERSGKTPNKDLLKDIESLRRQLSTNNKFIEDRQEEIKGITADYDKKIDRFKELRGIK